VSLHEIEVLKTYLIKSQQHAIPSLVCVYSQSNKTEKRRRERVEMDAGKETAANLTASAKAGMEKTKATTDEKVYIYIYIWLFFFIQ
jgi:hypothetical protein